MAQFTLHLVTVADASAAAVAPPVVAEDRGASATSTLELSRHRADPPGAGRAVPPHRVYPEAISWSHSKDGVLRRCLREFGLRYALSRGGQTSSAPTDVRQAFRLKQLTFGDASVCGLGTPT